MEKPKICVPLIGKNLEEIKEEAELVQEAKPDLVEWRADFYRHIENGIDAALKSVKEYINGFPLIFTLRTKEEGGASGLPKETRFKIMSTALESRLINYIDIETASRKEFITPLLDTARRNRVKVIISSHNFNSTPSAPEIINRLKESARCGGDIVKIAVMPESPADVLTLLSAAYEYKNMENSLPLIAVSMGQTGTISRIGGGLYGSIITFASLKHNSAPGQLPVGELRKAMELVY